MKIHIFTLLWRNEIKRSSQLRKLLKWVVENKTWKKSRPLRDLNPDLLISRFYLFPSMMFSPKFWKSKFGILKIQIGMKKKSMFGKLVLFPSLENSQFPLKNPYNIHIKFQSGNLPIFPVLDIDTIINLIPRVFALLSQDPVAMTDGKKGSQETQISHAGKIITWKL